MEINVVCTEKLLVHKTPFPLAGAPLTTPWLPSITFVKDETMTKFILINMPLCIANLQQEGHNSKFGIFELLL